MPNDCERGRQVVAQRRTGVVRPDLEVGRQQRAQVVAELDVGRRHVVERADRHRQHAVGDVGALLGDASRRQAACAVAAESHETRAADAEERVQHRGDEHLAAPVRSSKFVLG